MPVARCLRVAVVIARALLDHLMRVPLEYVGLGLLHRNASYLRRDEDPREQRPTAHALTVGTGLLI